MRKVLALIIVFILQGIIPVSQAAGWKQEGAYWMYRFDDGSVAENGWYWIDGNHDGIAECYYFGSRKAACYIDTTTPDGYIVDDQGRWVVNGVIQTKNVGTYGSSNYALNPNRYIGTYVEEIGNISSNALYIEIRSISDGYIDGYMHCGGGSMYGESEASFHVPYQEGNVVSFIADGWNTSGGNAFDSNDCKDLIGLRLYNGNVFLRLVSKGYGGFPGGEYISNVLPTNGSEIMMYKT